MHCPDVVWVIISPGLSHFGGNQRREDSSQKAVEGLTDIHANLLSGENSQSDILDAKRGL
jgi:hypothetical protein